jgi:thiamine biosynthesis lipoprotein
VEGVPDDPPYHRFSHQAMNTRFSIVIDHPDTRYAGQAAQAAFAEIDRMESALSRFVESSDISRLNRARSNHPTRLGLDAFNCLRQAKRFYNLTGGAFDASLGTGMDTLEFDRKLGTVAKQSAETQIDLGGIGKGYALDGLPDLFAEWEVTRVCAHSGGSTVLALDPPTGLSGWPVGLGTDDGAFTLSLLRASVSASGTAAQGEHLIDPTHPGRHLGNRRCWACSRLAAESDCLSTALMILPMDAVQKYFDSQSEVAALIEEYDTVATRRRYFGRPALRSTV